MRVLLDTNCIVALICDKHINATVVRPMLARFLQERISLCISSHTFVEAFAVATRIPEPVRLPVRIAAELLNKSLEHFEMVNLTGEETRATIQVLAGQGLGGGLVYDALILAAARKAKADTLVTFNARDFERLNPAPIKILDPSA